MADEQKRATPERHFFFVADGQTNLGFVAQSGSTFTASNDDGRKIGIFPNLRAAADAVDETYRAGLQAPAPKKRKRAGR
jgi:hypothetical protein